MCCLIDPIVNQITKLLLNIHLRIITYDVADEGYILNVAILRPRLCTRQTKCAQRSSKVMRRSER